MLNNSQFPAAHRLRATSRSGGGPRSVSFVLAAIAVYGDILKRIIPGTLALLLLYVLSALVLFIMLSRGRKYIYRQSVAIHWLCGILILVYFLQFLTRFDVAIMPALMMLIYVTIPLAFIVVIPRAYRDFDLRALALFTAVFMIPVHVVGAVQQFFDAHFMVSTNYSETGGIIARNFLDKTGHFNRLPSLFASADRYAGVSAMQFLLSFVLLTGTETRRRSSVIVFILSVLSAATGLMVAGARSRILIVAVSLVVGGIALLIRASGGVLTAKARSLMFRAGLAAGVLLTMAFVIEPVRNVVTELPILQMLSTTVEKGDIQTRFDEAVDTSTIQDETKFFGDGLGTSGGGRPGEFGIRSLWIEGGVFWTTIMLTIHVGILLCFARGVIRATLRGSMLTSILLTGGGLFWLFGLLAGLSSSFELSLALLLFPTIAVIASAPTKGIARELQRESWARAQHGWNK